MSQAVEIEPDRLLPLKGGRNFRDLGGYRAADGRTVRWRTLYRSGTMSGLTDEDYACLAERGIAVVIDLRSNGERAAEPTVWRGGAAPRIWARDYDLDLQVWMGRMLAQPDAATAKAGMTDHYREIAYQHEESLRALFDELANDQLPLAFHCAAGKDRTGIAAALVLSALGVSREQVLHDYSLTEQLVDLAQQMRVHVGEGARGRSAFAALPAEIRAPLLRSDPDYMAMALDELDRREGSVEGFLKNRLGVTPAHIATLRARLLTA